MSNTIQHRSTKEKGFTIIGVTFLEIKSFVEKENNVIKPYFAFEAKVESVEDYHVWVRYKRLLKFHEYICQKYPKRKTQLPIFPPKTLFPPTYDDCVKRRKVLQRYFNAVVADPEISIDPILFRLFERQVDPATKALLSVIKDFDMTGAELLSMQDYEEIHLDFIPASFLSQHLLIDNRRSSTTSTSLKTSISPSTLSDHSELATSPQSDLETDWVELGVYAYNDQIERLMEGIKEFCFSFRETIDHIDMTLGAIVLDWEDETKVLTNTERSNYIKSKVVHMTEVLQNEMIISHKAGKIIKGFARYLLSKSNWLALRAGNEHKKKFFDELGGYSSLMTLRYYAVLLVPLLIPLSPLCADRRGLANKQHIASVQQKLEQLMNEDHVIEELTVYLRLLSQLYFQVYDKLKIERKIWNDILHNISNKTQELQKLDLFFPKATESELKDISIKMKSVQRHYSVFYQQIQQYFRLLKKQLIIDVPVPNP
jgi:hypothetical protein